MVVGMRWKLLGVGLFLSLMWLAYSAMTVVPGGEGERSIVCTALAFLAGGAFGAALLTRPAKS